MNRFIKFIAEDMRPLTPAEWQKPNSSTKKPRTDILKLAIADGTPVPTVDNKEVILKNSSENIGAVDDFVNSGYKKAFTLIDDSGKPLSSSKIGKSAMFGGGKGAGGGTENTAAAESQQCLYLAAMLKHGDKPLEFFTPSVLKDAMRQTDLGGTTFDEVMSIDPAWAISAYLSAQYIIKNKFVTKQMVFHRDSSQMKAIYSAKNVAFKNSDLAVLTNDKWNPGDIWGILPGVNLKTELDTSSVAALNQSLIRLFNEKKVVGISLKLVKKKAKHSIENLEPMAAPHRYVDAKLSSGRGTFYSNKGGTVVYDAGVMEVRPNNYLGANKIEIMGKTARGGGAGWGVIADYAKRYMNYIIPEHKKLKTMAQSIAAQRGDGDVKEFFKIAQFALPKGTTLDTFKAEISTKDAGWISAKLGAAYVAHSLHTSNKAAANKFINSVVSYAGSKTDDSSVYVKVYE